MPTRTLSGDHNRFVHILTKVRGPDVGISRITSPSTVFSAILRPGVPRVPSKTVGPSMFTCPFTPRTNSVSPSISGWQAHKMHVSVATTGTPFSQSGTLIFAVGSRMTTWLYGGAKFRICIMGVTCQPLAKASHPVEGYSSSIVETGAVPLLEYSRYLGVDDLVRNYPSACPHRAFRMCGTHAVDLVD